MAGKPVILPDGCPPLTSYYVYLTGGCNLACRHCWLSPTFEPGGDTGGHLPYEAFALAIEQGLPLGLEHVKLTGGEPLLHPDLLRMVDLLREKEVGLTIETNGTLLTRSLARYLKDKSTLHFISLSLDGATPESHDAFRGVKGSFDKTCQAIGYLVQVGYRPQVIMSLHQDNMGEIEPLVKLAEKLGAGSVKFSPVRPTGRGELMAQREQLLDIRRLIEMGRWVESELQKRTRLRLFFSWPLAFYGLQRLLALDDYSCNVRNILGILPARHLALCGIGVQVPELCYGQLGEDLVADVWMSHPALIGLRQSVPADLEGICGRCIFRQRCLGMCVAENYHAARRLTAPYWFCHEADKAGLFPRSRLLIV